MWIMLISLDRIVLILWFSLKTEQYLYCMKQFRSITTGKYMFDAEKRRKDIKILLM